MQPYCMGRKPQQLLLLVWIFGGLCASAADTSFSRNTTGVAVCSHRTINYITHSLEQRCPTSPPAALPSTTITATEANSSIATTGHPSVPTTTASDSALPNSTLSNAVDKKSSNPDTATVVQLKDSAGISEEEADTESPLGKDNFLSFEEWKRRNLDKYGQSAEQVGKPKKHDNLQPRRQPINALDSLGDDGEIDLDFSAFAAEKPQVAVPSHRESQNTEFGGQTGVKEVPKTKSRSKDAGKTFKERFNYASFDCAATVLKTNPRSSGSSAVLVENKDSYMLNECSVEKKFLILDLCEDILIDTIVLANYEFFSSIFRTFRVSVSDRYPLKLEKWKELGTFEARNTREIQAFLVENPLIWAKYVRIEFLSHYGNEFYCPLSLVRVHGTTMLEDYRHDEESNKAEDREDEDDQVTASSETTETILPEAVAETLVRKESSKIVDQQTKNVSAPYSTAEDIGKVANGTTSSSHTGSHPSCISTCDDLAQSTRNTNATLFDLLEQCSLADQVHSDQNATCSIARHSAALGTPQNPLHSSYVEPTNDAEKLRLLRSLTSPVQNVMQPSSISATKPLQASRRPKSSASTDAAGRRPKSTKSTDATGHRSKSTKSTDVAGQDSNRPTTSTQPPPPNPTIQESFFKSVQKRLQMLESNSTLSLQYIEEQSRILRDAFNKVEQRQLAKTTKFLDYLNNTVLNELRDFRQQYDQLWQATVLELEIQREQSQHDAVAMNARLGILADELLFQKRMAILQSILVLLCIGLVLFSRGAVHSYLEHPLVQSMLTRSATLKMGRSFLETPSLSPESTRPNSSHKSQAKPTYRTRKGHARVLSNESQDVIDHAAAAYSPPTPASYEGQSEGEAGDDDHPRFQSRSPSSEYTQRSSSSPSVVLHHADDDPDTPTQTTGNKADRDRPKTSSIASVLSSNDGSSQSGDEEEHLFSTSRSQRLPSG